MGCEDGKFFECCCGRDCSVDDHCLERDESFPDGFGCAPILFWMLLSGLLLFWWLLSNDRIGFMLDGEIDEEKLASRSNQKIRVSATVIKGTNLRNSSFPREHDRTLLTPPNGLSQQPKGYFSSLILMLLVSPTRNQNSPREQAKTHFVFHRNKRWY